MNELTKELLSNRGPNAHRELSINTERFNIHLSGFVLWQQGAKLCEQPYSCKHHMLLLNGDIFSKRHNHLTSDTEWLTQMIDASNDNEVQLFETFQTLEGPYSIVYLNQLSQKLYILRDPLGRQSLLLAKNSQHDTILSSVLAASKHQYTKCIELPPLGIFCIDLCTDKITLNPWQPMNAIHTEQLDELNNLFQTEIEIRLIVGSPWLVKKQCADSSELYNFENILKDCLEKSSKDIYELLLRDNNVVAACDGIERRLECSISDRILATPTVCRKCLQLNDTHCNHAKIGILFSGGIDCSILAVLTDKLLDADQPIDLINVSFEKIRSSSSSGSINYNTPDRLSARDSLQELKRINSKRSVFSFKRAFFLN